MLHADERQISLWSVLSRGFKRRCPSCGTGHLFRAYLKQVEHCDTCTEKIGHIRADDFPAYLVGREEYALAGC